MIRGTMSFAVETYLLPCDWPARQPMDVSIGAT
jgi:hypothetical protein